MNIYKINYNMRGGHIKWPPSINSNINIQYESFNLRNIYLKDNNKTVLDNTPFEEFRINCLGETIDQGRKKFLTISSSKDSYEKKKLSFKYNIDNPPKLNINEISFRNLSGNINNTNIRIIDQ